MWKILKGDLSYYKSGIFIIYGTGLFFLGLAVIWQLVDIYVFTSTMALVFWVVTALMGINEGNEKHIRIYALLPVSVEHFAKSRMLFLIFLQIGVLLMWILALLFHYGDQALLFLRDILVMNALVLIVVNIFIIYDDLKHSVHSQVRFIFAGAVIIVLLTLIYLDIKDILVYPLNFNDSQPKTLTEVIVFNLLCVVLFWSEFKLFQKRVSYIE